MWRSCRRSLRPTRARLGMYCSLGRLLLPVRRVCPVSGDLGCTDKPFIARRHPSCCMACFLINYSNFQVRNPRFHRNLYADERKREKKNSVSSSVHPPGSRCAISTTDLHAPRQCWLPKYAHTLKQVYSARIHLFEALGQIALQPALRSDHICCGDENLSPVKVLPVTQRSLRKEAHLSQLLEGQTDRAKKHGRLHRIQTIPPS